MLARKILQSNKYDNFFSVLAILRAQIGLLDR